jgi:hypothetical protein
MATRAKTETDSNQAGANAQVIAWEGLLNGDDGDPIKIPGSTVRSAHVKGTFGSGGTIVIEGSNDGSTYVTLTDPQGNAISKTSEAIETLEENTLWVRPRVSAGDGTTDLKCYLLVRRNR